VRAFAGTGSLAPRRDGRSNGAPPPDLR
jgi:hypothetical protein